MKELGQLGVSRGRGGVDGGGGEGVWDDLHSMKLSPQNSFGEPHT